MITIQSTNKIIGITHNCDGQKYNCDLSKRLESIGKLQ